MPCHVKHHVHVQITLHGLSVFKYLSAAYFVLEAMVTNEFSSTTISCASGLDAKTQRVLQELFVNSTAAQKAVIRQAGLPQPG
jgi:hypothetical protein